MNKLYYSIKEISELVNEEQHILRYWEKEFTQLKPRKNRGGNRIYSEKDLQLIKFIKKLLRKDKLSLAGAKENVDACFSVPTPESIMAERPIASAKAAGFAPEPAQNTRQLRSDELNELFKLLTEIKEYLKN